MAEVIHLFRAAAFDPETLKILCAAFDRATRSLRDKGQPYVVNEIIAQRIIALAEKGERDPVALAEDALVGFGFRNAS